MRTIIFTILAVLYLLISCHQSKDITGEWVESIPGMEHMKQGFRLEKDGTASSINMETLKYESWKNERNKLILFGKSIGNGMTIPFSDTLNICSLTNDSLIVKRFDMIRKFAKYIPSKYPEFPDKPSREAYEGFKWEIVESSSMKFWAQSNNNIHVIINDSSQTACIERTDKNGKKSRYTVMRLFKIRKNNIQDVLKSLEKETEWDNNIQTTFEEVPSQREGVKRYVLKPAGKSAEYYAEKSQTEPIPSTCGGWGVGNSGQRYFEIYDNVPELALFVEIGQDAPLFDELSIVLKRNKNKINNSNDIKTVKGQLVIGHEVRTFVDSGDSTEYWVIDKSGKLIEQYKNAVPSGMEHYTPVYAELKVKYIGKSNDGFAAEYAGVYEIIDINCIKPIEDGKQ